MASTPTQTRSTSGARTDEQSEVEAHDKALENNLIEENDSEAADEDADLPTSSENDATEGDLSDGQGAKGTSAPEASQTAAGVHTSSLSGASFQMDQYGNGPSTTTPASSAVFMPFDYDVSTIEGSIVAKEDVMREINYPGSKRKGYTLAYPAGSILSDKILDCLSD